MKTIVTSIGKLATAPAMSAFASTAIGLVHKALQHGRRPETAPTETPVTRPAATIEPADAYGPLTPVWAFIGQGWHPGLTLDTSPGAAWTAYRIPGGGVRGVEQVPAAHLIRRKEQQPLTDRVLRRRARATLASHHPDPDGICLGCTAAHDGAWYPCLHARRARAVLDGQPDPITAQASRAQAVLKVHRAGAAGLCAGCLQSGRFELTPCGTARDALAVLTRRAHQILEQMQ